MKTLKLIFPILALTSMILFSACKKTTIDPAGDPPPVEMTGTLTIGSETFDLTTWEQGPTTYLSSANAFNTSMVKVDVGSFSMNLQETSLAQLKASHTLSKDEKNVGSITVLVNGTPEAGLIESGTLKVSKAEIFQTILGTEYRLVDGSYNFSGETNNGEPFSASGTFKNFYAIFQ